jgi:hypothetical protein
MSHHKRRSQSPKRVTRRLDRKRLRAATRTVISGGHIRAVRADRYNLRLDQPPLTGEEVVGMPGPSKRRWCRGVVGQKHDSTYQIIQLGWRTRYVRYCRICRKHL